MSVWQRVHCALGGLILSTDLAKGDTIVLNLICTPGVQIIKQSELARCCPMCP